MTRTVRRTVRGFTLLELLASVALLAILGALLFEVFSQSSKVVKIGNARIEIYQYVRALFESMERELQGAFDNRDAGANVSVVPFRVYHSSSALKNFGVPVRDGTEAVLFTSALIGRDTVQGSATYGQTANAAKVAYWLSPNNNTLNRYECYDLSQSAAGAGWEFALNILEFNLGVLNQYTSPPAVIRDDWDSTATLPSGARRGLPKAVTVTVRLTDESHISCWEFSSKDNKMQLKQGFTVEDDPMVQTFSEVIGIMDRH
jgi:prepilin-type N-terminal cleavage/methylation domain-containing protein